MRYGTALRRILTLLAAAAAVALTLAAGTFSAVGSGSAPIYSNASFTCQDGAPKSGQTFGLATISTTAAGEVLVTISLEGATPKTSYDLWVNQYPGTCPLAAPSQVNGLTTNGAGAGSAHLSVPLAPGAQRFWISVSAGYQVFRSSAIQIAAPATSTNPGGAAASGGTSGSGGASSAGGTVPSGQAAAVGQAELLPGNPALESAAQSELGCPPKVSLARSTCYLLGVSISGFSTVPVEFRLAKGVPTAVAAPSVDGGTVEGQAVTCPSATTCLVVGGIKGGAKGGSTVIIWLTNGTLTKTLLIPGSPSLSGIACPSASSCLAVGRTRPPSLSTPSHGVVVRVKGGSAAPPIIVKSVTELNSVACRSAASCVAVGAAPIKPKVMSGRMVTALGAVVRIGSGAPSAAKLLQGSSVLNAVACTPSSCVAAGSDLSTEILVLASVTNAGPGKLHQLSGDPDRGFELGNLACAGSKCYLATAAGGHGAIVALAGDAPSTTVAVRSMNELGMIICPTATACLVEGRVPADGLAGPDAVAIVKP